MNSASGLTASASSTITDNVGRTPKQLVEEISKELRSIEEKFQRSDGIEAAVARQEATLSGDSQRAMDWQMEAPRRTSTAIR